MAKLIYLGIIEEENPPSEYDEYYWISDTYIDAQEYCKRKGKKMEVFPGYVSDTKEIYDLYVYLGKVKNDLVRELVPLLNEYNHCKYSCYEWNVLLGMWMESYVGLIYDKYMRLKMIDQLGKEMEFYGCDENEWYVTLDYREFHELSMNSHMFHLYVYSDIYRELNLSHIHLKPIHRLRKRKIDIDYTRLAYQFAYRRYLFFMQKMSGASNEVVLQNSYLPREYIHYAMSYGKGKIIDYHYNYVQYDRLGLLKIRPDYNWREMEMVCPGGLDEYEFLCRKLIRKHLPVAYVEGYRYLRKRSEKIYGLSKEPKAIIHSPTAYTYDETLKHFLIQGKRKGAKLFEIQHGGDYGILDWRTYRTARQVDDGMFTWGWKLESNKEIEWIPMPAAKLMSSKINSVKRGEDILYVSYTYPKYVYDTGTENYIAKKIKEDEINFFSNLSDELLRNILVRDYPEDFGWKFKERVNHKFPMLRFDKESDFYVSLNQARMVVLSNWSTTIVEALYAGKPIIIYFYDRFLFPEARVDFEKLKDVGVLYNNWEDLTNTLEKVYVDVDKWWNEPERQRVVKEISKKYAYMKKHAKDVWQRKLLQLARDANR